MRILSFPLIAMLFPCQYGIGQNTHKQNLRGTIIDQESLLPLIGANVTITSTPTPMGTSTDADGRFAIPDIPVGRHETAVTYLGYDPRINE